MLALFITGIFSRNVRHWAVCPQLKKAVPLLLLLPGTVLPIDGDVSTAWPSLRPLFLGKIRCTMTRTRQQRRSFSALQSAILPARPGDEAICAQHSVPSSEEGSRIPLTHSKRASRATPQYRMVLLNVMLALFITGIFSRYERQWAVCPQLEA